VGGAAARPFAADEVPVSIGGVVERGRGVGADIGGRMFAAGAAGTCADRQPGRVLVEHQSHRRQHAQSRVGDTFVEVEDEYRAPWRDRHRRVDRCEKFRNAGLQYAEWNRSSQRDAAVVLRQPADGWPDDRRPCRPGLRAGSELLQQRRGVGQFGYPPSLPGEAANCDVTDAGSFGRRADAADESRRAPRYFDRGDSKPTGRQHSRS
jgi:hypothetical protein